jgi:hypothetical protein
MTSAPAAASIRDSASGLPCSMVMARAMLSLRSRRRSAALRMTFDRSKADVLRHFAKPHKAAATASSRSALSATACEPIVSSFAGFSTGAWPPRPERHCPSMKSCASESMVHTYHENARCLRRYLSGRGDEIVELARTNFCAFTPQVSKQRRPTNMQIRHVFHMANPDVARQRHSANAVEHLCL